MSLSSGDLLSEHRTSAMCCLDLGFGGGAISTLRGGVGPDQAFNYVECVGVEAVGI